VPHAALVTFDGPWTVQCALMGEIEKMVFCISLKTAVIIASFAQEVS